MDFTDKLRDGLNATFHVLLVIGGSVVFVAGIGIAIGAAHFGDWVAVGVGCALVPVGGVMMNFGLDS